MGLAVIKPTVARLDLAEVNRDLAARSPADVVRWAQGWGCGVPQHQLRALRARCSTL
jgi:hypothetical protein